MASPKLTQRSSTTSTSSSEESITKQLNDTRSLYLRGKTEFDDSDYDSACETFRDVAQRQEALLGKYHKETVKTYWRLGKCCCKAGRDYEALEAFQRSSRMASSALGEKTSKLLQQDIEACWKLAFPQRSSALEQMYSIFAAEQRGDSLYKEKDFKSASESYIKALDIQSSLFEPNENSSLDAADIRMKLGQCYLQISKLADAEQVLQKSHECYVRRVGKEHPATYSATASMRKLRTLSGRSLGGMSSKFGWLQSSLSSLGSSRSRSPTTSRRNLAASSSALVATPPPAPTMGASASPE